MARYRTWAEWNALEGDAALSEAERELVECCKAGKKCILGEDCPDGPSKERTIRADLLRHLILGGCEACRTDEWGVQLWGAYISGQLSISFAAARGATAFFRCRFEKKIEALHCCLDFLNLNESVLVGLDAPGTEVRGGVFLLGIDSNGEICLQGATVGGQLACAQAKLCNRDGDALNAEGAEVTGDVFLRGAEAEGEVSLSGARISGQLDCEGAKFRNAEGCAFNAQRMQVAEGLLWRGVEIETGTVDFSSAHVSDLVDHLKNWPIGGRVVLDGFTYGRISGDGFLDLPSRLEWLRRGTRWKSKFFPQPYTQLAKAYREMGHDGAARKVLMARERLLRWYALPPKPEGLRNWLFASFPWIWGWIKWLIGTLFIGLLAGYGYAPGRSFAALGVLFLAATFLAEMAWREGSFAPNDGPVLVSQDWQDFADRPENPAEEWSAKGAPGMDWDSFNAFGYAADLVVPILDLGQTEAWAPSKDRGCWGKALWCNRWVLSTLGWVVTALGAAAITGIIRRE